MELLRAFLNIEHWWKMSGGNRLVGGRIKAVSILVVRWTIEFVWRCYHKSEKFPPVLSISMYHRLGD